ncbi:hypothetical protein [Streptomyces cinnamoneus]|uniref:Protein kinase domain-containing protein n=1 Tax=Streptomyces cinnamoneus TaxID=53446 RepID=A0A918TIC3_STRCJ|nr:hypothetical protein [Streptomyces cinnamoneus]GHC48943.1 hypothetical protein GCM10010507_25740 [Streptomyces cinnamoneus]
MERNEPREADTELAFVSPQGTVRRLLVGLGPDRPRLVRPPAVARPVRLDGDRRGLQVRLPAAEAGNRLVHGLLEAETSAALALHRAYGGTRFRGLFPVPLGHDMNAAEPFILYAAPRGRPLSALTQGVSTSDQRAIERDLVLAVGLMAAAGLVHRGIVPPAVRWDGRRLQLWDLGSVARTGQPRTPWGVAPYASPEQRAGVGAVDPRDALWSVGQLLHELVTGRPGNPDGPAPDLARHHTLAHTLAPVFAPRAADRPTAAELLGRLMPDAGAALLTTGVPDPLDPYRREFDEALRRKHASLPRPPRPPGEPVPPPLPPYGPDGGPATGFEQAPRRRGPRTWFYGGGAGPSGTSGPEGDRRR